MDNKDNLIKLYELLDQQIEKVVAKNDITPNELESMYKSICVMEKVEKMITEPEYGDSGYSGYSHDYYDASYMRGRSPMTGRYVSRDGSMRGMNGRSGHSIHDRAISKLEHMMDETNSAYERNEISKMIRELEQNK